MTSKISTLFLGAFLIAAGLLGQAPQPAAAASKISVLLDGKVQQYEQPPMILGDRCMVPLRAILESLGAEVIWNEATQSVTATKAEDTVTLQIGSVAAEKNGQALTLPVAPQLVNERTMVPIRFVSEAFGATVIWHDDTSTVEIRTVPKQYAAVPSMSLDLSKNYTAVISTNKGTFKIQLLDDQAPLTVNNFVFLARDHFYDNVKFHRILQNFVIQTGDPTATGAGGPGYEFQDELPPAKLYAKGIVAMANAGPNTNGSQFFIGSGSQVELLNDMPFYTVFGEVVEGLDIIDKIAATPVEESRWGELSQPSEDVKILSVSIEVR